MTKTLTANFPGRCTNCSTPIAAGDRINWTRGGGSSHVLCPPPSPVVVALTTARPAPASVGNVDQSGIVAFLTAAKAHLKFPKVCFLAPDGTSELRLSLAGSTSKYPGAVQVKLNGEWIGRINVDGSVVGNRVTPELLDTLTKVATNPAQAAAEYGKLKGHCAFCDKLLTDDRTGSSIDVGYGPKCAKNYGLPHAPKGKGNVLKMVGAVVAPVVPETFDGLTVIS